MNTLGPEVDARLEDIGDALEGKKVLDEPYVDKKTILLALKEQNKVIRMLQMAFVKNNEKLEAIEETFKVQTTTIEQLKGKVSVPSFRGPCFPCILTPIHQPPHPHAHTGRSH